MGVVGVQGSSTLQLAITEFIKEDSPFCLARGHYQNYGKMLEPTRFTGNGAAYKPNPE